MKVKEGKHYEAYGKQRGSYRAAGEDIAAMSAITELEYFASRLGFNAAQFKADGYATLLGY